ncbi:MAG: hypothetical protein QW128_03310 [Thermoprotei archaeon]
MKPMLSVYVPYYVPIAYKKENNKIYVTSISILRGTSIGVYKNFKGLDINCQLSNPIQKILEELYDTIGRNFGIVIAIDAPPFWEVGVQPSIVLGMNLILEVLSTNSLNAKTLHSRMAELMTKLVNVPWIYNLNLSKGVNKFIINDSGELEGHVSASIRNDMRIIIGVRPQQDSPTWINEINMYNPDEEYSRILRWTSDVNFKYNWNNMDVRIISLQKLRPVVEELINYYSSEEIIVSQPDNMGVRFYRF